jgi:hypothetical protein
MADLGLTEAPTKENQFSIHPGREINEAGYGIFQFQAKLPQLGLIFLEPLTALVIFGADLAQFFLVGFAQSLQTLALSVPDSILQAAKFLSKQGDVAHNGADQRQHGIRLLYREVFLSGHWFAGDHLAPPLR